MSSREGIVPESEAKRVTVHNGLYERPHLSRFFTVGQSHGRWWFITPEGRPFWSIGMNHIDSATLRCPEGLPIWEGKYRNSQERWIREGLVPDLRAWGFNTIGWTQEVVVRGPACHRHSRSFTPEEYRWADMPYCHLLPFAEIHQWEYETRYPDVFSRDFEDWCDFVARDQCARLADDRNLIGYFYTDCPTWAHCPKGNPKGPWFDPERLKSDAGRESLSRMASRYYQVTHDAIRRADPGHLILGDRYEGRAFLPEEVVRAAVPYVDVLSFQHFSAPETVCADFERWHKLTGKPVLLADACAPGRKVELYEPMIRALRELPCCVGWHVCGAYLKNRCRGAGFRDEQERPDEALVAAATGANHETQQWAARVTQGHPRQ
jgi:hypothetical protein